MIYKIVVTVDTRQMIYEVNILIDQGWEPLGGICKNGPSLLQVMIRKD